MKYLLFLSVVIMLQALPTAAQDKYVPTVGSKLLSLSGQDLVSGRPINIDFAQSPGYTLLHFWYSNSDSCLNDLTSLKQLVEKYRARLQVFGFPYEKKESVAVVRKLLVKYGMNWPQLLQYRPPVQQGSAVVQVLQVQFFPTYLLLDREGVILVRTHTLADTEAVLQQLQ